MQKKKLPILKFHAECPNCHLPTAEFNIFESGAGGEFSTYIGKNTISFYRINMDKIKYLGKSIDELLAPVLKIEKEVVNIPEQVECKNCCTNFSAKKIEINGECFIYAPAVVFRK